MGSLDQRWMVNEGKDDIAWERLRALVGLRSDLWISNVEEGGPVKEMEKEQ